MRKNLSPAVVVVVIVLVVAVVGGVIFWRTSAAGDGKKSGGFAENQALRAAIGQKYRQETGVTDSAPVQTGGQPAVGSAPAAQPPTGIYNNRGRNRRRED